MNKHGGSKNSNENRTMKKYVAIYYTDKIKSASLASIKKRKSYTYQICVPLMLKEKVNKIKYSK